MNKENIAIQNLILTLLIVAASMVMGYGIATKSLVHIFGGLAVTGVSIAVNSYNLNKLT